MTELNPCPHCNALAELEEDSRIFEEDSRIFLGQDYSDRYPEKVARLNHGYRVRCVKCGCQTCWWHYANEAINAWNTRHEPKDAEDDANTPECTCGEGAYNVDCSIHQGNHYRGK